MNFILRLFLFLILFSTNLIAQEMRKLSFQEQKISYNVYNSKEKNLIIMIHGLGDAVATFQPILKELSTLPFKIITFDLPGCGINSEKEIYFKDYPSLVQAFIKQEKTTKGKVVLLGHSLGGLIVLLTQQQATKLIKLL